MSTDNDLDLAAEDAAEEQETGVMYHPRTGVKLTAEEAAKFEHLMVQSDWLEEQGAWGSADDIRQNPFVVGRTYLFRQVTFAWCGTVRSVGEKEIVIEPAACIFDTGRFTNAIREGFEKQDPSEIEPIDGPVVLGRGALVDAMFYNHPVPTAQK